jgi:hypothetical protein
VRFTKELMDHGGVVIFAFDGGGGWVRTPGGGWCRESWNGMEGWKVQGCSGARSSGSPRVANGNWIFRQGKPWKYTKGILGRG